MAQHWIARHYSLGVPLEVIFSGVWPFLIALIVLSAFLIAFPQIVLFLPEYVSR